MKIYDLQQVQEMASGDKEFIKEIVKAFLEELPPDVAQMREAAENNNPELAYGFVHKMKPNLQLFGLNLSENVKNLETWSKEKSNREDILQDVAQIEERVFLACKALKKDYNIS